MSLSPQRRASGFLLAALAVGFPCLLLRAASDAPCCSEEPCQVIFASDCCDGVPGLQSAPPAGVFPGIASRVEHLAPRWVEAPRSALVKWDAGVAFGVRTTVLRL